MRGDKKRNLLLGQYKENIALSTTKKNRQRKVVESGRKQADQNFGLWKQTLLGLRGSLTQQNAQPKSTRRSFLVLSFSDNIWGAFQSFLITTFSQKAVIWTFKIFLIFMSQKASKGKSCRSMILS